MFQSFASKVGNRPLKKGPLKKGLCELAAVVLACLSCLTTSAGDWFQWRGPNRDGVAAETGLLTEWPKEGPELVYKTNGLGSGFSSLAIVGNRIFTQGNLDGQTHILCLNRDDGSIVWKSPFTASNGDPNGTPTVDRASGLVFAISNDGVLVCCKASDGSVQWKKNFKDDFGGRMESGWGYSESPLVDGNRLVCTPGGTEQLVVALDKSTGNLIWSGRVPEGKLRGNEGAGYSSIVVSQAHGRKQYVQLVGHGLVSHDAETGELLWHYDRIANTVANIPTPIAKDNYVFTSTGYDDGGTALLEIQSDGNSFAVNEVYYKSASELQNHHGGMVMIGDYVYMGQGHNNGFPACVEWKTGRSLWKESRGPGTGSAAIVSADNKLYFRYQDGVMALIDTDTSGYKLLGQFKLAIKNGESWPHPVVLDGRLYVRDQNEMVVYDLTRN